MTIWTQLGQDINGALADDESGYSVSISTSGNRVAIGEPRNDDNGTNSGQVRVYQFDGTGWTQLGEDIEGEATGDFSGSSVNISGDGNRVAIGAYANDDNGSYAGQVRVYQWNGTNWQQLGEDIDGESAGDWSGWSVTLDSDGDRVAMGSVRNSDNGNLTGQVRVYQFDGTNWQQVGADIEGDDSFGYSGWSISLNRDGGNRVAIGARRDDGNGSSSGQTRVYDFDGTTWLQLGQDLVGEEAVDFSGESVSLNSDGTRVAIGAPRNDGNGTSSGHVRVYQLVGTNWEQLGGDIDGNMEYDQSSVVSLNTDGSRVAIGSELNDSNGTNAGLVRVYQFDGTNWIQVGQDLVGQTTSVSLSGITGQFVSLNGGGDRVVIGYRDNDDNGSDSGQVRIYSFPKSSGPDPDPDPNGPGGVICYHPSSQFELVNGQTITVNQLQPGHQIRNVQGHSMKVVQTIPYPSDGEFYQVTPKVLVTRNHLVRSYGSRMGHKAFRLGLNRVEDHTVKQVYAVVTNGPNINYFIPVNDKWAVEIWGQSHPLWHNLTVSSQLTTS